MAKLKASTETVEQPEPLPPVSESPLPVVEPDPIPFHVEEDPLTDDKFKDGIYIHRKTRKPFALYKHAPDGYERTHSLKNTAHFWQGTEEEFFLAFEKQ